MEMQLRHSGPVGFGPSIAGYEPYERPPFSTPGQWQRGLDGGMQPGPPSRNWVQQEPGGTGRYRHVMEYDDPLMPGTFPGHWLGPDGEPSVGDQSNLPGANPAFSGNGRLFLQSLLAGKNNNTGVTLGDTLASNPLDNPLDAGYERDKAIIDNQGPIDPLDVYQPPDPALDRDPLTGIPGFHRVSVPYADPWLVADANVPLGSDRFGGGANLNQPVPLEGPSDYQNRFKEEMQRHRQRQELKLDEMQRQNAIQMQQNMDRQILERDSSIFGQPEPQWPVYM